MCFFFESNVWRVFWAFTCLSDYSSFCCKDSVLWQREWLAEDYTVPLPCTAGHEELITILMLSRSDRLWLMGNCAGAAHLKERQGKLAPLAPLALLGSVFKSTATAIGVSSAQPYTPAKYADLGLLLCHMPVLYPSHRLSQWPWCISVWPLKTEMSKVQQLREKLLLVVVLIDSECMAPKLIILFLPSFLSWCTFISGGKNPCKSTHLWTWRKKLVETC